MSSLVLQPVNIDPLIRLVRQFLNDPALENNANECIARLESITVKIDAAKVNRKVIRGIEPSTTLNCLLHGANPTGKDLKLKNSITTAFGEFYPVGSENILNLLASSIDFFSYSIKSALDIFSTVLKLLYESLNTNLPDDRSVNIATMTIWFYTNKSGEYITDVLSDSFSGIMHLDSSNNNTPSAWFYVLKEIRNKVVHKNIVNLIKPDVSFSRYIPTHLHFDNSLFNSHWTHSYDLNDVIDLLWQYVHDILSKLILELIRLISRNNSLNLP